LQGIGSDRLARAASAKMSRKRDLRKRFPDSPACSCKICLAYCRRPGWWTVEEAAAALETGYGHRMMLEMGPGNSFGVLSPAFKGAEQGFATDQYADRGCTFLERGRCELHGTGFQPLECRFCHHDRVGEGPRCHSAIEKEWNTVSGRKLVVKWSNQTDFWRRLGRNPTPTQHRSA
jgi:hypothetical protein